MNNRSKVAGIIAVLAIFIVQGCTSDSPVGTPGGSKAPNLPPLSTMKIDMSIFESANVDEHSIAEGRLSLSSPLAHGLRLNFLNAAVRALYLQVIVYSGLVEPVMAFEAAIHSIPQPQQDGSWLWTYIVVEDDIEYRIYLTGRELEEYVEWTMAVSSSGTEMPLDHFVWFDGRVFDDGETGYWQFYEPVYPQPAVAAAFSASPPQTPGVQSIRIDWEDTRDTNRMILLVNMEGVPEEGNTLTFYESSTSCTIDFYNAEEGTNGNITWYPDGSGSIQWPDYNDGMRSCWDTDQIDTDCPE